jgi:hypothetical protein
VQLQEKVKNELQLVELDVQYGDQLTKAPLQQSALQLEEFHELQFDGFLLLQVEGFLDGPKQNPNGAFLFPVLALFHTVQFPSVQELHEPNVQLLQVLVLNVPQQKVPERVQLPVAQDTQVGEFQALQLLQVWHVCV